jgi:hypothetical protein
VNDSIITGASIKEMQAVEISRRDPRTHAALILAGMDGTPLGVKLLDGAAHR